MKIIINLSVSLLTLILYGCSLHPEQRIDGYNNKISNAIIVCDKNKAVNDK